MRPALPPPPKVDVPEFSPVGQAVTASVRSPATGLDGQWVVTHRCLPGGTGTFHGPRATFVPTEPGMATFVYVPREGASGSSSTVVHTRILPPLASGHFRKAGVLLEGRTGLAALALGADQILVTGGSPGPNATEIASAEIFDPSSGRSIQVHPMATGRMGHCLLKAGDIILVIGGNRTGSALPAMEAFDPASRLFLRTPQSPLPRRGPTATWVPAPPGVLVAGGRVAPAPAGNLEWLPAGTSRVERVAATFLAPGHSATLLPCGRVLLVSREGGPGAWRPWAGLFDPSTGRVVPTRGRPRVAREGQVAVHLIQPPRVLLMGGRTEEGPCADVETYDPETGTFQTCEPLLVPRQDFAAALLPNGEVLVAGGSTDGITATDRAERFDPATGCFAPAGNLLQPRRHPCLVTLPSGGVLVLGGDQERSGALRTVEAYELDRFVK